MYPYTQSELDAFVLLQTGLRGFHRREDTQTHSYCSVSVIFMGLRIAKIHQETIAQELCDVTLITLDDFRADFLVCTYHIPIVFGIKLR